MSELRRTLRFGDLVLVVIGTVIGSGIWLVPGAVLRDVGGDIRLALLVWLAGGVCSLLGALTFGELGAMIPEAGGSYAYVREAFGAFPAFLLGWTLFLAISTGSQATLAVAFANYAGELVPLGPIARQVVAVGMLAVVAVVNVRGTRRAATVQNWSTGIKVGAILVLAVAAFIMNPGWHAAGPQPLKVVSLSDRLSGAGIGLVAVLWAYEGWQNVTNSAGETVDPQRNFARGIVVGTAALILIYLIANLGYLAALGPERVAASDHVAADAVRVLAGPGAAKLITIAILISMFSATNGLALTGPRCYFAMAQDGVFFRRLAQVHPRFGTPAVAIVTGTIWAMLLTLTGTFEQLFTYVIFASWLFAALAAASVFVLRIRRPDVPRPFRVPGYPFTPALFVAAAVAIVANTIVARPVQGLEGLGIVLAGTPVYLFWKLRR